MIIKRFNTFILRNILNNRCFLQFHDNAYLPPPPPPPQILHFFIFSARLLHQFNLRHCAISAMPSARALGRAHAIGNENTTETLCVSLTRAQTSPAWDSINSLICTYVNLERVEWQWRRRERE